MSTKVESCLKEGERGERHKGLRKIEPSKERARNHLNKALHNFSAMLYFQKGGFTDWSASAAFYTLYHLLLAILAREGYESRNQSCTFALIEQLIDEEKVKIEHSDLREIFDKDITQDIEHSDKILDLREKWQYSVKTVMELEEFLRMKDRVNQLVSKLRQELEKE